MRSTRKSFFIGLALLAAFVLLAEVTLQYRVIPEDCVGCRICVAACPVDAISMVEGKAVIDQDMCIDCGICLSKCPVEAIVLDTLSATPAEDAAPDATPEPPVTPDAPEPDADTQSAPSVEEAAAVLAEEAITDPMSLPTFTVLPRLCIGCERCVAPCPVQAITMVEGKAVIDQEACINCGICERVCPVKAIERTE
ncbi:MAG: 4Fe-4S binding protein [Candidatus Cloacimonetes bacterium]|nr:4Fe-4S binding protein [Candidatus Cloacimonadota bacterium]